MNSSINKSKIRHSIGIITYNQENYLEDAIDWILEGELDNVYEIIVSDDCSNDNTPSVIEKYTRLIGPKFKKNINKENLGISENINIIRNSFSGNVLTLVAGDDFCSSGLIEKINEEIISRRLDPEKDLFIFSPAVTEINKQKKIIAKFMNGSLKKDQFVSLAVRHKLYKTEVGMSKALVDALGNFEERVDADYGIFSDFFDYVKLFSLVDEIIIINEHSYFHRDGVGVTSKPGTIPHWESYNLVADQLIECRDELKLSKKDVIYLEWQKLNHIILNRKNLLSLAKSAPYAIYLFIFDPLSRDVITKSYFNYVKLFYRLVKKITKKKFP